MITKKSFTKLIICLLLILALFPIGYATTVYAAKDDEEEIKFSIEDLINQHGDGSENSQELTSGLGLNLNFESNSTKGWTFPTFAETKITQVAVADFTNPDGAFSYGDGMINYTTIGTDGTDGNRFGLLFLLKDSGIAGIESPEITIPAHAYYVLTFNVKVAELGNSGTNYGINAKLVNQATGDVVAMDAIKTESEDYVTYAFLIQGNEFSETKVKLQLLFGNAVEIDGKTTKSEQIGYAAVDTIRLFSVTYEQFINLTEDDNAKQASYLTQNSNYVFIDNGYKVALMSFCKRENDEVAIERIFNNLDEDIQQKVERYFYNGNVEEALDYIAQSQIIVGTRFHANILELLLEKTVIPVVYSNKTTEFLKDIQFEGKTIDIKGDCQFNLTLDDLQYKKDVTKEIKEAQEQFKVLDELLKW